MRFLQSLFCLQLLVLIPTSMPSAAVNTAADLGPNECKKSAQLALKSRRSEVKAEYQRAFAVAANIADDDERAEYLTDAKQDYKDGLDESAEQFAARLELCGLLPSGPYDPVIDPAYFTTNINNPFFPLVPGQTRTYSGQTQGGTEIITVTVTNETKVIMGVTCRVVRDIVKINNVVQEDTLDYFAQDLDGNVWYFGELSQEFENGELAALDGSWIAGENGAEPGIVMLATRAVGNTYRQEFLLGEAEDCATVLSLTAPANVTFGSFTNCVQTSDFTPLEPGSSEHKFYASGVGLVMEVNVVSGNTVELVSVTP